MAYPNNPYPTRMGGLGFFSSTPIPLLINFLAKTNALIKLDFPEAFPP